MIPEDVRVVVFDVVGTLVEPQPAVAQAYLQAARRHGVERDVDEIRHRFGAAWRRQEELDAVRSEHDLPTNARRYVDRIAELLDRPVSIVSVGPDRAQTIIRGPEATRRPWLSPQPAKA